MRITKHVIIRVLERFNDIRTTEEAEELINNWINGADATQILLTPTSSKETFLLLPQGAHLVLEAWPQYTNVVTYIDRTRNELEYV